MLFTRRLIIHGNVQGVGYRYSMVKFSRANLVTGWVKNRSNGTVEAVIQGAEENVEKVIRWAHQGPASANVTRVETMEETNALIYSDFTQQSTE